MYLTLWNMGRISINRECPSIFPWWRVPFHGVYQKEYNTLAKYLFVDIFSYRFIRNEPRLWAIVKESNLEEFGGYLFYFIGGIMCCECCFYPGAVYVG